uniref:Uncharacterized protein n=2 Tax=Heterosigma akashiwo TaxID=2829 RepID=A0A7S4DBN1_HETAK
MPLPPGPPRRATTTTTHHHHSSYYIVIIASLVIIMASRSMVLLLLSLSILQWMGHLVSSFEWEYVEVHSFSAESEYTLEIQRDGSEYDEDSLSIFFVAVDDADEHGLEEAEEHIEEDDDHDPVYVSNGNILTLHQDELLLTLELEAENNLTIFTFETHDAGSYAVFFEHGPDELPFSLKNASGTALVAALSESAEDHSHESSTSEEDDSHDDEELEVSSATWGLVMGATLIASAGAAAGLALFSLLKTDRVKVLAMHLASAFGSGAILAAALLHLIPEGYAYIEAFVDEEAIGWKAGATILGGLSFSLLVHAGFAQHQHQHHGHAHGGGAGQVVMVRSGSGSRVEEAPPKEKRSAAATLAEVRPQAWNVVVGDALHNCLDGMVIAVAFAGCGNSMGWTILGAVMAHEIPQEIADFFVLLDSGLSFVQALLLNLFSGFCAVLGGIIVLTAPGLDAEGIGYMLLFGSGIFLFVGAAELLPDLLSGRGTGGAPKALGTRLALFALGAVVVSLPLLAHLHCDAGFLAGAHDHDSHSETDHDSHDETETSTTDHDSHDHRFLY